MSSAGDGDLSEDRINAISNGNSLAHDRIDELEERVEELEVLLQRVLPDEGEAIEGKPYGELQRGEKVRLVQDALIRKALSSGGTRMTYDDVLTLFNQHPSPSHAYKIMELAGVADGFDYDKNPRGSNSPPNRLIVHPDGVPPERVKAARKANTGLSHRE